MTDPSDSYERRVAHAEFIKVINNQYSISVALKFVAVTKRREVNITKKHIIIFTAIKVLELSATMKSQKGLVYNHTHKFLVARHISMFLT